MKGVAVIIAPNVEAHDDAERVIGRRTTYHGDEHRYLHGYDVVVVAVMKGALRVDEFHPRSLSGVRMYRIPAGASGELLPAGDAWKPRIGSSGPRARRWRQTIPHRRRRPSRRLSRGVCSGHRGEGGGNGDQSGARSAGSCRGLRRLLPYSSSSRPVPSVGRRESRCRANPRRGLPRQLHDRGGRVC
jgi:hypothetical protein